MLRPHFIVDQYNTLLTVERDLEVKLKLQFFNNITDTLTNENLSDKLSGYLIFDSDLKDLKPGTNMHIHAVLLSSNLFTIIELLDNDDEHCIVKAERKLARTARAVGMLINEKIPVKGVIVFPSKVRLPTSIVRPDNSILYKGEQAKLLKTCLKLYGMSHEIAADTKTALAEMLRVSFLEQCHPTTKEEAIYRAAQRFFIQRPDEKIRKFSQFDFNSVTLTGTQKSIKDDLLAANTLIWGGYGIGKSVAIVAAITEYIEKFKLLSKQNKSEKIDLRIMFISAQGLLSDVNLELSPFILMIQKWIKEFCEDLGCAEDLLVINYRQFLDLDITYALQTRTMSKGDVVFVSYLLKKTDVKMLTECCELFEKFDVIILEETHALHSSVIDGFLTAFERAMREINHVQDRDPKFWITSNTERPDLIFPDLTISPKPHAKPENMRNTPAVTELAKAINTEIVPERYPSTDIPLSSMKCHINVSYEFECNDKERIKRIAELAVRWKQWLPKCSLLFIDCERSNLYEELKTQGIPLKTYEDNYNIGEPLFLQHSDPVEAIVAGAEWHVLIVHIKINTLTSIEMINLFNKRVISRVTTKVFIFSDANLRGEKDRKAELHKEGSFDGENFRRTESENSDEFCSYTSGGSNSEGELRLQNPVENNEVGNESFNDFIDLLEKMKVLHKTLVSNENFLHHKGYDFTQLRYLENSLSNESSDTYLVRGRGNAFIVKLNPSASDEVIRSQTRFESVWKIRLPAYNGSLLVSPGKTDDLRCISNLLYLAQPKASFSLDDASGSVYVGAEEATEFSKNGKMCFYFVSQKGPLSNGA